MWIFLGVVAILMLAYICLVFYSNSLLTSLMEELNEEKSNVRGSCGELLEVYKFKFQMDYLSIQYHEKKYLDFFNSSKKLIALYKENYFGNSLTNLAISMHEFSHAIQHRDYNFFWVIRETFRILYVIASLFVAPLLLFGLVLYFLYGGILIAKILLILSGCLFLCMPLFRILNIPNEANASSIAFKIIKENHLCDEKQLKKIKKLYKYACRSYVRGLFNLKSI